jgi:hypothetical protein
MSDVDRPGIGTRVRAALRGERRAEALEAMRRAGAAVYAELAEAEQARAELVVGGEDVWTASPAVGGHLLATWNAFVLQTPAAVHVPRRDGARPVRPPDRDRAVPPHAGRVLRAAVMIGTTSRE